MQLLQITVTPAKYELQVEHAKLEANHDFTPQADIQVEPAQVQMQSTPTRVQLDTYEARHSLGFAKVKDIISSAAQKGSDSLTKFIRNTVDDGAAMAKIEEGVTISQIFRQKLLEQRESFTVFLPSRGADISWQPGSLNMNISAGSTSLNWNINEPQMKYVPGNVHLNMIQYGDVQIEYIGGPLYVPPSAAPDYKESSAD